MTEQEYTLAADLRSVRIAANALRYVNTDNSSVALADVADVALVLKMLDRIANRLAADIENHMEKVEVAE